MNSLCYGQDEKSKSILRITRLTGSVPRAIAVLLVAAVPVMTGCRGFFVPPCKVNNSCGTTTTTTGTDTGTTGTGTGTGTTGTGTGTGTTGTGTGTTGTGTGTGTGTTSGTGTGTTGTGTGTSTGTGTGSGITPSSRSFVYTANAAAGSLDGFSVGSGRITHLAAPTDASAIPATAVTATPDNNLLFVASASGSIFVYTIGSDGALQIANHGASAASVPGAASMSTDRKGKLLFVGSSGTRELQVFQIGSANNYLMSVAQGAVPLDSGDVRQVVTTPDDQHVFVALGLGGVDAFTLDAGSGTLANRVHVAPLDPGTGKVNAITSDGGSRYLYVAESGGGIRVLAIGTDGTLNEVSGSPFAAQLGGPSSLAVDPTGSTLYAAYPASNVIAGYEIGAGGTLTAVSTTPFSPAASPTALSIDASGKYLLAMASGAGLQMFSFGTAGKLTALPGNVASVAPAAGGGQ
jgi:6-phosphogluconolactonase